MHTRVLGLGVLILVVAAVGLWWSGLVGQPQLPMPAPDAPGGAAPAAGAPAGSAAQPVEATAVPAAASLGADARIAAPANAADDKRPAIVGRVVGAGGRPLAGATVYAVPGMGFANANGQLDFDTFDFADFDELEDFDMTRMMQQVREQLADRAEVTTDADGRFRIQARGATRGVGLRVAARGHALLDRRVERPTTQDLDVGTLSLQAGAMVSGRVLTPDGAPVVGARVSRVHEAEARMMGGIEVDMPEMGEIEALRGGEAATTDDKGRFELQHLAAGEFALRARHPDHPTAKSATLTVEAGRELRDVLVTMARGGEIRGVVRGLPADTKTLAVLAAKKPRADADPTGMMAMFGGDMADMLADMGISVGERKAELAADGSFVLRGLALDTYRIWVGRSTPGFAGNGTLSNRVEAMPGGNVELTYEPGITVTLKVVDAKTQAPVERLWVRDRLRGGSGGMADIMANIPQPRRLGSYPGGLVTVALRPKPKQSLTLSLAAIGYAAWERSDITLPASGAVDLGTVALEPAPVLQVTVLDADTGKPLAGADVKLVPEGENRRGNPFARMMPFGDPDAGPSRGKTDRDGRCTLNRLVDRSGTVEVTAKEHAPFVGAPLAFTAAGPETFVARVPQGGTAEVTVVDDKNAPVAGVAIEHKSVHGDTDTKKADAQGVVRFPHLAPGAHSFRLAKSSGPMAMLAGLRGDGADSEPWQALDVADRAVATLRLVKKPTATLRGVVRENGLPLAGARVQFRSGAVTGEQAMAEEMMGDLMGAVGGPNARNTKTGDDGAYTLNELPEGAHRLQITHRGRAMPTRIDLVLQNGDNTFDVELDMTTVRGVVQDPAGNPVDGARLRIKKAPSATAGAPDLRGEVGEQMESMMPGMNLGGGSTIKTDATGAFELRGVDPDVELQVSATAKGFAPVSARITAPRGQVATLPTLRLGAAGKLRITAPADVPFAMVRATWAGEGDGVPPVMQMLRKGKVTLDGLRPGPWDLAIMSGPGDGEGSEPPKHRVEVVAGQTVDVQL